MSDRIYVLGEKAPADFRYPATPYAVAFGDLPKTQETYEKNGLSYPVALRLALTKNPPMEERLASTGFKSYGLVALINPNDDLGAEYLRANACVLGNDAECREAAMSRERT